MSHLRAEPLKSDSQLSKLDGLGKADAARVKAANRLYEVALLCIFIAVVRGAIVSVENPSSSYFWPILILLAKKQDCAIQPFLKLRVRIRSFGQQSQNLWHSVAGVWISQFTN